MATLPDPSENNQRPERVRIAVRGTTLRDGKIIILAVDELNANIPEIVKLQAACQNDGKTTLQIQLDTAHMRTCAEIDGHRSTKIATIYHFEVPIVDDETLVIEVRGPNPDVIGDNYTGPLEVTATFEWLTPADAK